MTAMTAQRFRMFAVLACAGWLVVLFYGCSSADPPVVHPPGYPALIEVKHDVPNGEECHMDAWCKSGFCNRTARLPRLRPSRSLIATPGPICEHLRFPPHRPVADQG